MSRKSKVLISAYACNPAGDPKLHPGEDLVGWNLVKRVRSSAELWVITHSYNRSVIERETRGRELEAVHFVYVNLPSVLRLLYRVSFGERIYYYLWQIEAWRTARRLHRREHFDLAQHLTFGNYWMPSFIGAFLPVPFIWGPIGGGQKVPRTFFGDYSLKEKLAEWGRDGAQWAGRHLLFSRWMCMRRAKVILVCNCETKAMFPERYWGKIRYFPVNGISPDELAPRARAPLSRTSSVRILTAGRLIRLKAFDLILKAMALVQEEDSRVRLELVGQGPEETNLKRLASVLDLGNRVKFVPWLSRADLLKRMRVSDVFAFMSLRDGGGAVVIEAMASRIPVVCLDTGGPGFHVQEGWGIKIRPGDPGRVIEELAQAILRLARDPGLRMKLGRNGLARAMDFYIWEKQGRRLADIYTEALNGSFAVNKRDLS